jgi:hypothetical protein
MSVIAIFALFVVVGDALAIGISSIVERFSDTASLFVFLALFIPGVLALLDLRGARDGTLHRPSNLSQNPPQSGVPSGKISLMRVAR